MNILRKTVCAIAICATSASVMAVESTELTVGGQIAPGSCLPSFTNGGEIAYGDIGANQLSGSKETRLSQKSIDLSIKCDGAKKVAFTAVAGRSGSLVGTEGSNGFGRVPFALADGGVGWTRATGIGFDEVGNKIGGMAMNIKQGRTTIDGSTDVVILSEKSDGSFIKKDNSMTLEPIFYSWGGASNSDPLDPIAFTTLTSTMVVQAFITNRNDIDLSQEVNLDGLVTFELKYL